VSDEQGQSAVVLPLPGLGPVVEGWRRRCEPSARLGMPAHITLLFPFLAEPELTSGAVAELAAIMGSFRAFALRFERTATFPGVLYLAPTPAEPLIEMTRAIEARWPDHPASGGAFEEVVPHVTVTNGADPGVMQAAGDELARQLPLSSAADRAALYVFTGAAWVERATLPLAP
jgi:2'-5' RNA ligase